MGHASIARSIPVENLVRYRQETGVRAMPPRPMLAQDYTGRRARFPCYVQPKLDGVRLMGHFDGHVESRGGTPFPHLTRVSGALEALPTGVVLDGELYVHGAGFQRIVSLVRNASDPREANATLQYHVFDIASWPATLLPPGAPYSDRLALVRRLVARLDPAVVKVVDTGRAESEADVERALDQAVASGYEGIVIRDPSAPYLAGKRSPGLLKYKRFVTDEYAIVSVEEASGKDRGTAVFVCATPAGREFRARPEGTHEDRAALLRRWRGGELRGAKLTVRYQDLSRDGVPRFPIGVAVRDYE